MNSAQAPTLTVLVIDDDPDLLPMLADTIRVLTHYTVMTADNGADGLERFFEALPQCVVVDVKMPELDGYQFVRAIRGDPQTCGTPIIMLTAMTQEKDRFSGLASGADHYLFKPVDPVDLVAAIHQAMQVGEAERNERIRQLADTLPPDSAT